MSGQSVSDAAELLKPSVLSGEGKQASPVPPAEQEMLKPSVVSGENNQESNASPAKEEEMLKPSVVPGQDKEASNSPLAKKDEMFNPSVVSGEDYQASDASPAKEDMWEMCLFLYCDPRGRPYNCSDFLESIKNLGLYHEVAGIGPLRYRKLWLIKLKTAKALRALANAGSLQVKGHYCAVVDPVVEAHEPITGNVQVNEKVPPEPGVMLATPTTVCEIEHGNDSQKGTPPFAKETAAKHSYEVLTHAGTGNTD